MSRIRRKYNNRINMRGFTLVELLVAIGLFSILAAMGYGGLSNIIQFQKVQQEAQVQKEDIERALLVMARDFYQIVPRRVRDNTGKAEAALTFDSDNQHIEFSRVGSAIPYFADDDALFRRSRFSRVGYLLEGEIIYRLTYTALDRALSAVPRRTPMLRDVDEFKIRFLSDNQAWSSSWGAKTTDVTQLPRAIEVTVILTNTTEYTHLFPIIESPLK